MTEEPARFRREFDTRLDPAALGRPPSLERNVYYEGNYGGFWRRFASHIVDGFILSLIYGALRAAQLSILQILVFLAYMIGFKAARGITPGYRLFGLKIISIDGSDVTFKQVIVRLISSIFSAIVLYLGFIRIAFDRHRQAWHDKVAGTYVIKTKATPFRKEEIPQTSLIRPKLFAAVVVGSVLIFLGFFGGMFYLFTSSGAYQAAEQYVRSNPMVRKEVGGNMKLRYGGIFGLLPNGSISIGGEAGEGKANFDIPVSGDEGEATVSLVLEKRAGQWVVTEAAYTAAGGKEVDITTAGTSQAWERHTEAGERAYRQGRFGEAEKSFQAALKEAQEFGPEDTRLATSFHDLAEVYHAQGQRILAELHYKRALEIQEKVLGPDHPDVATVRGNLAKLYQEMGREDEAKRLLDRARKIRLGL